MARIVIDTNMLLLFVVGRVSKEYISAHKRTKAYSAELYDVLCEFLSLADVLVLTPGIATEASNLARQFSNPGRDLIQAELARIISAGEEAYVASVEGTRAAEYMWLGLCDATTLLQVQEPNLVLATDDFDLAKAWESKGREVLNFNYIREERGL